MNEKTAFLGLISPPQCTIEQVLDLRENPRLDDSPKKSRENPGMEMHIEGLA